MTERAPMVLIWPYILETYPIPRNKPILGVMTHMMEYGSRDFVALDDDDAVLGARGLLADKYGDDWSEYMGAMVWRKCIVQPNRLVATLA